MNRIYQGKVTKVQTLRKPGAKGTSPDDWHDLPDWPDALWQHHQLFQDAVNYYAFALAVMASGMTEKGDDGNEKPTAMAQFAARVLGNKKPITDRDYAEGRWEDFIHKGVKRPGLKHSLARTLSLDAKTITQADCIKEIFGHAFGKFPKREDGSLHDVFRGVISELFPAKSRGTPQKLANEDPGWLCLKGKGGEPPASKTYRKQQGSHDFVEKLFQADVATLKELSTRSVQASYLSGVPPTEEGDDNPDNDSDAMNNSASDETPESVSDEEDAGYLVGADAVSQLDLCVKTARALLKDASFRFLYDQFGGNEFDADRELERLDNFVNAKRQEEQYRQKTNPDSPSSFRFQNWQRSGKDKDNIRVELFVLFHCDGGSKFTAALLKARLKELYLARLHSTDKRRYVSFVEKFYLCGEGEGKESPAKVDKARKAVAKNDYQPVVSSITESTFIPDLKRELGYILPSFTAIRGFAADESEPAEATSACKHGCVGWTKFDNAAYEEAIKSPHQIRQKQKERDQEAKKLEELKKIYEGKGREKGKAEDGEDEDFIPGGFNETDGDPRFAAMKRIHKALAVADGSNPEQLYDYGISQAALRGYEEVREAWNKVVDPTEKKLKDCIVAHQQQHRDDMGDSRLFEELIKEGNWCVWQKPTPELETEQVKKRFSTNIVRDYLRYCDVLEDLEKKKRPIQYTPADARESRRLFDFKGASQGRFVHSASPAGLSFTTQIARYDRDAKLYRRQEVRIHYTAPRLLRDEARMLRNNEDLQLANWAQPLMRALGVPVDDRHDFMKHAVSLMPDWRPGSQSPEPDRLLLNFVLTPKEFKFIEHLRKQMQREHWPWDWQFLCIGKGKQRQQYTNHALCWPHETKSWDTLQAHAKRFKMEFTVQWFANPKVESFRLLSVDLGQKQAGAYAIMEVSCCLSDDEKKRARFVGRTDHNRQRQDWYARVLVTGLIKLPGEDATVFRPQYKDGKPVAGSEGYYEELSGAAGRHAILTETRETVRLLTEMQQLGLLDDDSTKAEPECDLLSFPDQNAKLLIALRRAQSFAGKLHRWCWFLDPQDDTPRKDQASRRRTAIKEIAESDEHEWLNKDAHDKAKACHEQLGDAKEEPESHPEIVKTLKTELESLIKKLPVWLETIANRVYHSRRGRLVWGKHPDKADCHMLDFSLLTKEQRKALTKAQRWLAGQRGISITRIEQLEELRKRCQSLNQMLRRDIGVKPKATRDDSIPDPCPTILAKLDEIKEQRRNQTAHMILAQALGLGLAEPVEPKDEAETALREAKDSHGEYVKMDIKGKPVTAETGNAWRGIVDFIVIEDLSRYRTSQGRAPRENSRLMKWCHRAIRDKLKQMCEPFGIPLIETPAAYSSRFCSRTGVAGFRAVELTGDPLKESKWRWRVRKPEDEKKETKEQKKRREDWELLFEMVKRANTERDGKSKGQQLRTLLAPDAGGSIFIPISKLNETYQRPVKNSNNPKLHRPIIAFESVRLEEDQEKHPRLIHADINAAVNLGLRAVADPRLWSVHSRLRSERELGNLAPPKKRKGKHKATEPAPLRIDDIKLDTFWVSEREKRKFGEQTSDKRIEIVVLSVAREWKKMAEAEDEATKRRRLEAAQGKVPKASDSRHPNFFADYANLWRTHWGAASLKQLPTGISQPVHLVSGKALWGYVKGQSWKRCMAINAARLRAWGIEPPKEWET